MNKITTYFGIDISKAVFDVYTSTGEFHQFTNDMKGFKRFLKLLSQQSHCVMEATGYYHQQLAYFLVDQGIKVSVENPLSIKRFAQMKLSKIKTDKADAKIICQYAEKTELKFWKGDSQNRRECEQLMRLLESYIKQKTALDNKVHGEKVLGNPCKDVDRSLNRMLKMIRKEIITLEERLTELVRKEHQQMLTVVESIPGIGRKTAIMLIVLTDGFTRFSNAAALCSYIGLTPVIRQSGSSVRGQARISKMGNRKLRKLLFMCSFNACQHNKACKEMYERITLKGKSKKLALVAVSNKLVKQAFAIAQSGLVYDENFRSRQPQMN